METIAPIKTIQVAKPTTRKAPMYKVIVHNDPVSKAAFVVQVLMNVFRKTEEEAFEIMTEAHETEAALVDVMCLEQAEFRVEQAHSLAGSAKYPLKFSIERDE
jgi:ATP-dependent Clp protease adaptor protein ClpS